MHAGYRNKYIRVKSSKKRKTSSTAWLQRQLNDPYVAMSKIDGYKSRAAYKLLEINQKFDLFKSGIHIVDLGAAPGGWSQVAVELTKSRSDKNNKIIAIDLLEMDNIPGVTFINGDFLDSTDKLFEELNGSQVDIVMSDMAPNTIGHGPTDHIRIMDLCEKALEFALLTLKPGGHFISKIFSGGAEAQLLILVKKNFSKVKHFKPLSSRKESKESYLVCIGKKS